MIESVGDLTKDDIVDDRDWPLKVISDNIKRFHCLYLKITAYTTYEDNYSCRTSCEQLFLPLYSTGRCAVWCWARPVSDS